MPELPEVETLCRGLRDAVIGRTIRHVVVRQARLRLPVPPDLPSLLEGLTLRSVSRRAKYLLIDLGRGSLIVHLGMSGSLRVLPQDTPARKHDHLDLLLDQGLLIRLSDPRRFGAVLWTQTDAAGHPLLKDLGIEPLSAPFDGSWLYAHTRGKKGSIKQALMDGRFIAVIGNIYANEALFGAGVHPRTPAGRLGRARCERLAAAIRETLDAALAAGGSSLRDFVHTTGESGYFQVQWRVYGRVGLPCPRCTTPLRQMRQGARSTFYCPKCQK